MAIYLGTQPVSLKRGVENVAGYLGGTSVTVTGSVPGAPVGLNGMNLGCESEGGCYVEIDWIAPESDGGSAIIGYRVYVGGVVVSEQPGTTYTQGGQLLFVEVSAYNAIGEGPKASTSIPEY